MRAKTRLILENCIEAGAKRGYRRAFKHNENPSEDQILEHIEEAIMAEIYEYFAFDSLDY